MKCHIVKTKSKETKRFVWSAHEANKDGGIGEYIRGTTTPEGPEKCKEMLDQILNIPEPEIVETVWVKFSDIEVAQNSTLTNTPNTAISLKDVYKVLRESSLSERPTFLGVLMGKMEKIAKRR